MAAPNLLSPTTVTGKTATAELGTSLASVIQNTASSGKVLKINTIRAANIGAGAVTTDLAFVRSSMFTSVTRIRDTASSNDITNGEVGTSILSSGYSYWHKNNSGGSANYTGTVLAYLVGASFPVTVTISNAGTPVSVVVTGIQDNASYVRLDHPAFTSAAGSTGDSWVLSLPDTSRYILKGGSIESGKTLIATDKNEYIYLEEGDQIKALSSSASSVHLTINYEEIV